MKLSTFAIIVMLLAGLFGLAFIAIPEQISTFYGITHTAGGLWVTRYWGASLLLIAMIYWSYSGVTPAAKSWPKLLIFSIIYDVIQLVLTVLALKNGVGNANGWSTVGLFALLIIGSVYFLGVCSRARAKAA